MDFIAAGLALCGVYLVGNRNKLGFLLLMACSIAWAWVAIESKIYGLLVETTCLFFLNMRGYFKWGKE